MLKQDLRDGYRGQVMLISSAAARRSPPYMGAYSATKAAQLSLAEAMRVELRPHKIAVTSVHPMVTRTEFGSVAETLGDVSLPKVGPVQAVEPVVRRMVRAIERPARELWPSRPSRFLLSLATIAPGLSDRILTRFREKIEQQGQSPTGSGT
jgi:short-subunit dehydrogenase